MTGMTLAKFFLLIVVLELMLFSHTESNGGWRRDHHRRRRLYVPPCDSSLPRAVFKWANKWHQSFIAQCPNRKF